MTANNLLCRPDLLHITRPWFAMELLSLQSELLWFCMKSLWLQQWEAELRTPILHTRREQNGVLPLRRLFVCSRWTEPGAGRRR